MHIPNHIVKRLNYRAAVQVRNENYAFHVTQVKQLSCANEV